MKRIHIIIFLILLVPANFISAQGKQKKINLSGYVLEKSGTPIADAMIIVDGNRSNKSTNENGFFRLKIPKSTSTLGIFSLTHGTVEFLFDGSDSLTIFFDDASNIVIQNGFELDKVVDMGYGSVKKNDITTNVGSVNVKNNRSEYYRDIYDMIRGEVAGVRVSGKSIRIQGNSSMVLSNEPLFILNGTPVNSIDQIPPSSVASINVLKGAAASAYGSRGSNGVIVIKLK